MQSVLILGRQPALGLSELESLYGAAAVRPVGAAAAAPQAALLDVPAGDVDFERLGGSLKLARVLTVLDTTDWRQVSDALVDSAPEHTDALPEGKLTIGLSVYGLRVSPAAIQAAGLNIKKAIRKSKNNPGRSVRLVPNKELELNTAQVLHNNLTAENGWELLLIRDGNKTIMARTTAVQDIESYTRRDRERPKRDARVGMLPPKLAQIIINLATRSVHGEDKARVQVFDEAPTILDPFCGTGVVLLEAKLAGFNVYGTDIEPRMIEYTQANLDWLPGHYAVSDAGTKLEIGDATTHTWQPRPEFLACETYLGRPFTSLPSPEVLNQTISEVNLILKKFLKNIHGQLPPDARLCIAVPAWQTKPGRFKHLPLIDQIQNMGYNRISFEHTSDEDLLYYREGQVVARQLLVLEKK
ncbi:MAG TPA: DNA methyltransferase [Candidatus Saccharimonadales bacterium]|nr:DNA methyltransferase [Candidatus Saccharimonadales bacterium]